jgi:hypothetical protein
MPTPTSFSPVENMHRGASGDPFSWLALITVDVRIIRSYCYFEPPGVGFGCGPTFHISSIQLTCDGV